MGYFYIDDSVHDEAGFVIGACVYSDIDLTSKVSEVIIESGFDPKEFEYKSSTNYSKEPEKIEVRTKLKRMLQEHCKLGMVIIPRSSREELGYECIRAVKQFIDNNENIKLPVKVFMDGGMFKSTEKANSLISKLELKECEFNLEQNSKEVAGIQLADLSAHGLSIQLKDELGLITKTIKAGKNSGYDPNLDIDLGFEMWATTRHILFNQGAKEYSGNVIEDATLKVEPFGLYLSMSCDNKLKDASRKRFGKVYLGCIH